MIHQVGIKNNDSTVKKVTILKNRMLTQVSIKPVKPLLNFKLKNPPNPETPDVTLDSQSSMTHQ